MKERLGVRVPLLLALALLGALAFARTESAYAGTGPVLVVVAHPDNEALGMSGVIANSLAAGRRVYVAVVTNGDSKRSGTLSGYCGAAAGQGASTAAYGLQRDAESLDAMSLLGLHWSANPTTSDVFFLGYPNSGLTTIAGSSTAWTGDQTFLHTTYAEDGDGSNATCNGDLRYLLSGHHSTFTAGELATDLDSLFALTHPTDVYTHVTIDKHPDHSELSRQVTAAAIRTGRQITIHGTISFPQSESSLGCSLDVWPNPSLAEAGRDRKSVV